jgi:hypothetical protein
MKKSFTEGSIFCT